MCGSYQHFSDTCYLLQCRPLRSTTIARYNHSLTQERRKFARKVEGRRFAVLKNLQKVGSLVRRHRVSLLAQFVEGEGSLQELVQFSQLHRSSDETFLRVLPKVRLFQDMIEVLSEDSFESEGELDAMRIGDKKPSTFIHSKR